VLRDSVRYDSLLHDSLLHYSVLAYSSLHFRPSPIPLRIRHMIDLVLLSVIGLSALLGLFRGFVGIVVSTASWLLAGWASFQFGADAGLWLSDDGSPTASEAFGGYALTFIGVLLIVGLVGMVLKSLVRSTDLSGTDRALGFGLGVLRGAFLPACWSC
jgi:membrane protein required for colicin V production